MSRISFHQRSDRPIAPKPSQVELRFSEKAVEELEALLTHYPDKKSCILPALWIAQREYGWTSPQAIMEVSVRLERPYVEVEGVATFYTMYHKHPVGKHLIEVCTCLTCACVGAYRLVDHLKAKLGIGPGETTEDGMFTIEEVECLDWCGAAPVLQIGDRYEGYVDEQKLDAIIERLRDTQESTVTKLADVVVACQLAEKDV